jgi:hypothetical protein
VAELLQSEFDEIRLRRGVQDLNNLLVMLVEDGGITVIPDPTGEEIIEAREKASKDAEKRQAEAEKEAEREAKEREKQEEEERSKQPDDKTERIAALPHPDDQPAEALAPEKNVTGTQTGEVEAGKAVGEGEVKKADQKKATGR